MRQELRKLAKTMAKTISDMGYTREGHRMNHRHCLDVIAKTGGMKNWQAVVALKNHAKPASTAQDEALTCDEPGGTDFTMKPDVASCWVTVDGFAVQIIRTDEGVIVDILANRSSNIDAITSTYAHHADAEVDICESEGIEIDDVAEWVGLHYKVNFDAEPGPKRYEWILRYIESHASGRSEIDKTTDQAENFASMSFEDQLDCFADAYKKGGIPAIEKLAATNGIAGRMYCTPCEADMPSMHNTCLCCGTSVSTESAPRQVIGARAFIHWNDDPDGKTSEVYVSFGKFDDDERDSFGVRDDAIFYYCETGGEDELKALQKSGAPDFTVVSYVLVTK